MTKGRWILAAATALAGTVVLERLPVAEAHPAFWWQAMPAFDVLYGFAGCVAIVLVSKALGAVWLQREEEHYERGGVRRGGDEAGRAHEGEA